MEENKVVAIEEVTEETTKVGFGTKLKNGVKKHGKKVVAVAAIVGGVLLGYAMGKKSSGCECCEDSTEEDNYETVEDTE